MPSNTKVQPALDLIRQDPSRILGLTVGNHDITEPGQYVPRADAQSPPQLTYSGASPSARYAVISLDLDAPFPSFSVLGPVLHWIQPGLKTAASSSPSPPPPAAAAAAPLESSEPFVANYIGPAPPPGSAPHRYAFFLFEQPAGLDAARFAPKGGRPLGVLGRPRASLDDWVQRLGLGEVVAVNYFTSN